MTPNSCHPIRFIRFSKKRIEPQSIHPLRVLLSQHKTHRPSSLISLIEIIYVQSSFSVCCSENSQFSSFGVKGVHDNSVVNISLVNILIRLRPHLSVFRIFCLRNQRNLLNLQYLSFLCFSLIRNLNLPQPLPRTCIMASPTLPNLRVLCVLRGCGFWPFEPLHLISCHTIQPMIRLSPIPRRSHENRRRHPTGRNQRA